MMKNSSFRLKLCITLLCVNLAFIWGNSLLPGEISGAFSDWVKNLLKAIFSGGSGGGGGGGLLRKLAHFTEFTCLGLCLTWLAHMCCQKAKSYWLLPLLCGFLAACIDETIQIFVPLRGPAIKDVGIDTSGVILGIVIINVCQQIKFLKTNGGKEQ